MWEKMKSNLQALRAFGLMLYGFYLTIAITGSVYLAIERLITIVVIWMMCAVLWRALCALAGCFVLSKVASPQNPVDRPRAVRGIERPVPK